MADPKPRPSLRLDTLASALEQKLDNEAAILDLLVSALARGQASDPLWEQLHAAAQRDDRLAELAFAYERLSRDKKLKGLQPAAQAVVLGHAGVFFADVFGDADGAEGYLERALSLAPGDERAFGKYEQILTQRKDLRRLGELYAAAAAHRGDKAEQLRMLRRGAELVEGDAERALKLNLEILRLDPADGNAKRAIVGLYEKTGRLADLAKVLEQLAAQDPPPEREEALGIRLRLLGLYAGGLGEIERGLPHAEEILKADPGHEQARKVATELLAHKALTGRAAAALAAAHEASDEPAEAARFLGMEIEASRGAKKLEAQKKLSRLTLEQLGDLEKTFSLDEGIVVLDPADDEVRSRFVQLASALDKQAEATKTLGRAATAARDAGVRARIGADLGDLYRELGDVKKARASYQGVIEATDEEASLRAARALAALSAEPRDPRALAGALARLAVIEPEEGARLAATAELGKVSEEELHDLPAAIAAFEKLVGTARDAEAGRALARLYEATGAFAALAALLDRLAGAEKDRGKARDLAFRAADLRSGKLPDKGAALAAWQGFVATYGASREALGRIVPLLEHERRWEELGAALGREAALAPVGEQAGIHARLGQLRLARLADPRGALEAFRQAVAIDPGEKQSRQALDRMLSAGELRLAAAEVIEPIARAEGSAPALLRVLEARAALEEDPKRRRAALEEGADLAAGALKDPKRAVEIAARGLGEALASAIEEVPAWVDRVDRLGAGGDAGRRAAALRDALGDRAVDGPAMALLARRAGEALVESGDAAGALAVFRRALAFEPSSAELLARVDGLLKEQGNPAERLALHTAALKQAADPARRRELLHTIAGIERRDLGDAAAALATYRRALAEQADDRAAFAALLEIYEAQGAWDDLRAELERALARTGHDGGAETPPNPPGEERAGLLLRLAEVSAAHGRLAEAAACYAEIVAGAAALPDEVLAAAERVAQARDDVALLRAVLERRVLAAFVPEDEAAWLTRLGELLRDRVGDAAGAAGAFRRAAAAALLAGDAAREADLLERVLAAAPGDRAAAERLLVLHEAAGAWERLPAVYEVLLRAAASVTDAAKVLLAFEGPALRAGVADRFLAEAEALLQRGAGAESAAVRAARARVLARDPARFVEAAAAYRALLEAGDDVSGAEARAFDALLVTQAAQGTAATADRRWLFAYRVGRAEDGERIATLMAWAAAEEGAFGDAAAAAELYGRVVAFDPGNEAALAAEARLLLASGDLEGAAAALERRRGIAEGAARAALDLELAELLLDRLGRPEDALAAIAPVLDASPGDEAARRVVARALVLPAASAGARRQAADLLERAAEACEDTGAFVALMGILRATPVGDAALRGSRQGWYERVLDRRDLPPAQAFEAALAAAAEMPGELSFWERAEPLARAARAPERLAFAYRRALGVAAVRVAASARPLPASPAPEVDGPAPIAGLDAEAIEEIGRRAVEYHEEWFDEAETIVALLRRVVALLPGSAWAFERLKLLFNLAERWSDLFALYDDAVARAEDPETRRELLEDAALAAKDLASDAVRATGYYEALHALRPEPRVRAALERLYERLGRHRALIDLLAVDLPAQEGEAAQKIRARIAQLWLEGVGEAEPAVLVVEQMLDAEPDRAEAFALLERVMALPGAAPAARRRAAARLKERYRAEGRADDLVRMLEIDLDAAATPAERAERLRAIVKIRLDSLHDDAGAFEGTAALLALEPSVAEHRVALGRLADRLGKPARLAEALAAAASAAEGPAKASLLAQAAGVYEEKLGDPARAAALYRAILDLAGKDGVGEGDPAVLAAARTLDRLLAAAGQGAERAEVLERLASIEPDAAARRAARQELARMALEAGDVDRAVRALRAALAEDPGDEGAAEGLAQALEGAGRWEELVAVLEARAARGGEDARVRADRVRVARLLEDPIGDAARAVDAWMEVRRTFGADDESTDALASLLEATDRHAELITLLEGEATAVADDGRAADLWRRVADLHRTRTGKLDEAVAAYDLALEQRPGDAAARRGLEALLAGLDLHAATTRRTLVAAVASLSRLYAEADDHAAAVAFLEPRLAAAGTDAEKVAVLLETATICERRAGDPGGAFDAVFRAFARVPGEALATRLLRLADAAGRWDRVAAALAEGLADRADVPRAVKREMYHRVALWQQDRGDDAAAEAALVRALAIDPGSEPLLDALATVQRRAPGRALVETLVRLADAGTAGAALARRREAVEVAESMGEAVKDPTLARELAEALLEAASADFAREGASGAAEWAIEALVRFAGTAEEKSALFLRGAALPFAPAERRRLRLAAAELAGGEAAIAVYEALFAEDPRDPAVSARLWAIYRGLGRRDALIALRERQIGASAGTPESPALRIDLADLRAEGGDREGAIAALRENLAAGPHAPSMERLAALYAAGGDDVELLGLTEDRAALAEEGGDRAAAAALWGEAAALAEDKLGDAGRAIAAHRHASALGAGASDEALARLHAARGDHAAAAEALERICDRSPGGGPVLRLVEELTAAGLAATARARLERSAREEPPGSPLRERLAALYREAGEWRALAEMFAEDAGKTTDRAARVGRLREAAEIHLVRNGDPAAAAALLEQAVELAPDDALSAGVHLRLASARRAMGDLDQAATALRAMLAAYGARRPKERAVVHYELAQVSLAKGERARAVSELDAALRIDPAHPEILLALARLSLEEGQLERAARTYRALLSVVRRPRGEDGPALNEVSRAEVLFELAEIARLRGEADRAAEQLESAFEAARESEGERRRLVAALRARQRHDLLARALEAQLAASGGGSLAAEIQEELASLYEQHLDRPGDALEMRLAAIAVSPPSPEALARLLELARRAGLVERYAGALAQLAEAEQDEDRAVFLRVALGRAFEHDLHDDARAAAAYLEAEGLAAQSGQPEERLAPIWRALAGVYGRLGDAGAEEALLARRIDAAGPGTEAAELADTMYQLAALRVRRVGEGGRATAETLDLIARAFETDPQPDRAEGLLREALAKGAERAPAARALEHFARVTGRDRALIDALVLLSEGGGATDDPIREAVAIAERLGDAALAEDLLRRAIAEPPFEGDAPIAWALGALAAHRVAAGDLREAADLKERAARADDPDRERDLLLEVAALAAGPLGDPARAARLYEELRAREPAEREIWQPLAEVYQRLGDRARLAALLEETAPLLEGASERVRLRLQRARMAMDEDPEKAVTLLQEVVEEDPSEAEAAAALSDLLERLGRREELSALVQRQLDAAKDREDRAVIVALSLRLGGLLEQQWDEQGALDVYHGALDWEPKSREVLRQIVRLGMARDDSLALGDALDQLLSVEEGEDAVALALRLAQIRGAHGEAAAAVEALEHGWAARPGDARLRDELVKRYTADGQFRKLAELHVRDAESRASPAERVASLRLAAGLYREQVGDAGAAADVLARALAADPRDREVLVALIDALGATGQHARAADALGSAIAADPDDAWLHRTRASIHEALGKDQAALLDLEQAYEKSGGGYAEALVAALGKAAAACAAKGTPEARATRSGLRLRLAEVLTRAGEIERARAELTELTREGTREGARDRAALRALAALEEGAGDWDAAGAIHRKLLALEDGAALVETALRLANACARAGRLGDARAGLERAQRIAPDNEAVREILREVYTATGAVRELAALIREDAARAPDVATRFPLLVHAGRLLLETEGEADNAAVILDEAKSLRPEDAEATLLLADAYTLGSRLQEARAVLDAAVIASKGRRSRVLAAIHRRLARLDQAAGDNAAALGALTRAFDNDPQNAPLAMELGTLAVELDQAEPATRAFRAVTMMKTAPAGSPEGATSAIRAVAYYHLGRMAYLQGDRRKARLMIDKAVVDDPTLEEARALLDQLRAP